MSLIVLISCVKQKLPYRAPAAELYVSSLFRGSLCYARSLRPDAIYVFSALYGLVGLNDDIEPYDLTLKKTPAAERKAWAKKVLAQLREVSDLQEDQFVILAGRAYWQDLVPHINHYELPMDDWTIGERLHFLKEAGCL